MKRSSPASFHSRGWLVALPALGCGGGPGPGAREPVTGDWELVATVQTSRTTEEREPYYNPYCPPKYDVIYESFLTAFDVRVSEENLARANVDERRTFEDTCAPENNTDRTNGFYLSGPVVQDTELQNRYRIQLRSDARNFTLECEMLNRQLTCQVEEDDVEIQLKRP
jgi:hypothetical protein